jgi:enoyl-CoA hydratase/carnithine racemase
MMLEVTDDQAVRTLTMHRPPVNALNAELMGELSQALAAAEQDPAIRVVILTGAPGVFSAGLDVRALTRDTAAARALVLAFASLQKSLVFAHKPVIAAISGHCPAGGTVLSLLCDQRVMAQGEFRIGLNEVQIGLYPGLTIFKVFERIVGTRLATDFLGRGVMLDPAQALRAGLVDEVCSPETLMSRAGERAVELAQLPPKTYARTRDLVRRELRQWYESPEESLEDLMAEGWVSDEAIARLRQLTPS